MHAEELSHVTVVEPGGDNASAYGPVEIAWYPDHVRVTALGAGPASITEWYLEDDNIVVEIRPPSLDELPAFVPGAD